MSEEKKVTTETASEETTKETTDTTTEYGELIAESKKYRKRSQESETKVAELEAKLKEIEESKLKEKEEYKTLYEQTKSELDDYKPYKDKHLAMIEARKEALLQDFPEDKRDIFKDKDLDVLEFMHSEIKKPEPDPDVKGGVSKGDFDIKGMTLSEQRKNWADILKSKRSR
jgi:hypothetical protein